MEGQQFLARGASQRVAIADIELVGWMISPVERAVELEFAPTVVLEIFLILGIDRVHFPVGELGGEKRGDKELGHAIERAFKCFVADFEMIVGVVTTGVGVVVAAIGLQVIAVVLLVRIFLGAEKKHVLEKVREAPAILGIGERAHAHREGGG